MLIDEILHTAKGIKESFDGGATMKIKEFMAQGVVNFKETSEYTEIFNTRESFTGTKLLAEGETPPVAGAIEGYQVSLTAQRYGLAVEFTENDYQRAKDSTTMVEEILQSKRNALLVDSVNSLLVAGFGILNDAIAGATYLCPDGVALCGTHTWKSTGTTFVNKATVALSSAAVDSALEWAGAMVDAAGHPMPIDLDTIVVKKGSAAAVMAKKLFAVNIAPTAIADINIYEGAFKIVETPYITATNKKFWFMLDSKKGTPLYAGIYKMPAMNDPIKQNSESFRINATGYYKVGINNMPFMFYGSDGTT